MKLLIKKLYIRLLSDQRIVDIKHNALSQIYLYNLLGESNSSANYNFALNKKMADIEREVYYFLSRHENEQKNKIGILADLR